MANASCDLSFMLEDSELPPVLLVRWHFLAHCWCIHYARVEAQFVIVLPPSKAANYHKYESN